MSDDDVTMTPPARGARAKGSAYPRVTATPSVKVAAQDRRSTAVILTGAIGARPPFELQAPAKEHRSPGELGPARAPGRAAPRAAPRTRAAITGAESAAPTASADAAGTPGRRSAAQPAGVAPARGLAGLPGLGVFLGELGSPAKGGSGETGPRSGLAGMILGRGFRPVPSVADVDVSIGGHPDRERGFGRLAAPLRALVARRPSRATPGTLGVAAPVTRPTKPMPKAAPAPRPAEPEPEAEAPSQPGPLRRASSYLVNGLLDIAIRRFGTESRRR